MEESEIVNLSNVQVMSMALANNMFASYPHVGAAVVYQLLDPEMVNNMIQRNFVQGGKVELFIDDNNTHIPK